jgi:hypothetical protein
MRQDTQIEHGYTEHTYCGTDLLRGYDTPKGAAIIMVVAVVGGADDWAAYAENTLTRAHSNSHAAIAAYGTKLRESEARQIFPDWAERLEWRR